MTEYWVSTKKHYCKICRVWCSGHPYSIIRHETSTVHVANVDRKIKESNDKVRIDAINSSKLKRDLEKISMAADASLASDTKVFKSCGSSSSTGSEWIQTADPVTGKRYSFNRHTGESQWIDESSLINPKVLTNIDNIDVCHQPSHDHGWFACRAEDGNVYYANRLTGASQWEKPLELGKPSSVVLSPSPEATRAAPPRPVAKTVASRPVTARVSKEGNTDLLKSAMKRPVDPDTGFGDWEPVVDNTS